MFKSYWLLPKLPEKTICLTYDDGPGPRTLALARFLHDKGIQATFFVVGQHIKKYPHVLSDLLDLKHCIGNHTTYHKQLGSLQAKEIVAEVSETDRLIKDETGTDPIYFRAPYGEWPRADCKWPLDIAGVLNAIPSLNRYIGHIHWDIEHGDYGIGEKRTVENRQVDWTIETCGQAYLKHIRSQGKGVFDLHDWGADSRRNEQQLIELQNRNRTLELTKWLVPQLLLDGFQFKVMSDFQENEFQKAQ